MGCTITIKYRSSVKFAEESVTITIENTTYGALSVFAEDLKKLIKPITGVNYTQLAYNELLNELITALYKTLNEDL